MHRPSNIFYKSALFCAALGLSAAPALAQSTSTEHVYDPNTGKSYSVTTKTGANGATHEVVHKCAGGETSGTGKCHASRTLTNANGDVATRSATGIMGENGYRARQKSTGFGGRTTIRKRAGARKP